MPRRLIERCRDDSILEFRRAARQRFDVLALATAGHRTGSIYLWGYTAEMTLKAAYFSLLGLAESDVISWEGTCGPPSIMLTWASPGHIRVPGTTFAAGGTPRPGNDRRLPPQRTPSHSAARSSGKDSGSSLSGVKPSAIARMKRTCMR